MSDQTDKQTILQASTVIKFAWDLKGWIFVALITGILVSFLYFVGSFMGSSGDRVYSKSIKFAFPTAASGTYGNGTVFSPSHLFGRSVLDQVVKNTDLEKRFAIDSDALAQMVSSDFNAVQSNQVDLNFADQLSSLKGSDASYEILSSFTKRFNDEQRSRDFQTRSLVLSDPNNRLNAKIANEILDEIAETWSNFYLDTLQVSKSGLQMFDGKLLQLDDVQRLDYPFAIDLIEDSIRSLRAYRDQVGSLKGSANIADPQTKWFLNDIDGLTDWIQRFELSERVSPVVNIGLTRDRKITPLLYRDKLTQLNLELEKQQDISDSITDAIDLRRRIALNSSGADLESEDVPGDAFLNNLVALGKLSTERELQTELKIKLLEANKQITQTNFLVKRTEARLEALERLDTFPTPSGLTREAAEKIVDEALPEIVSDLNGLWDAVHRIRLEADAAFSGIGDSLFEFESDFVSVQRAEPFITPMNILKWLACFGLVFLIVLSFGILSRFFELRRLA